MPASDTDQPFSGVRRFSYFSDRCVTTCIRVGLSQRKNGLPSCSCLVEELERVRQYLVVDRLHAFRTEFARIFDFLFPDFAPARLHSGIVHVRRPAMDHVARTDGGLECRRVIGMAGVLHRVQVIEVAVEFIEAVQRGQELVQVAQMVLAELAGGVAHGLEHGGSRWRLVGHAERRTGLTDGGQSGADRQLAR